MRLRLDSHMLAQDGTKFGTRRMTNQVFTMFLPYDEVLDVLKVNEWITYDGHGWTVVQFKMDDQDYKVQLKRRVEYFSPKEQGYGWEFRWVEIEVVT